MKPYSIYCLKEPSGEIRYFGKTCQKIQDRFMAHLNAKPNWHVSRWIQALKRENQMPICEVLMTGLENWEANEEEIALIAWGRKKGLRLTNGTDGGDGGIGGLSKGRPVSENTKEKLRQWALSHPLTPEQKEKQLATIAKGEDHWTFGKERNLETREKISQSLTGHTQTFEQIEKRKLSLPRGDEHWTNKEGISEGTKKKSSRSHQGPVNKTGFRGVFKNSTSKTKPWQSGITYQGRSYNLGCYETPEEAARAYDKGAIEHYGESAKLNFPINKEGDNDVTR